MRLDATGVTSGGGGWETSTGYGKLAVATQYISMTRKR